MTRERSALEVSLPRGGFKRSEARKAIEDAGLPATLGQLAEGPFGSSSQGLAVLEGLLEAVDLGLAAAAALEGVMLEEMHRAMDSFVMPALSVEQRRFVAVFAVVALADEVLRRMAPITGPVPVDGALELDGLGDVLATEGAEALLTRLLRMSKNYAILKAREAPPRGPEQETPPPGRDAARSLSAFWVLLRRAVVGFARMGSLRPFVTVLEQRVVRIAGHPYEGLTLKERSEPPSGLLPIRHTDIVGNGAYVDAGMRLARDVAGYDFEKRANPKRINPVLFGLGKPGCGKTVTAHAIGNYFLEYCRERDVPARFIVVRRSDWASSYQNASATNLIRIFEEEVYGFDGVCGVYWADIDTAIASRASSGLRMEEKQNLGAVFGIFDGTLLPKDGKWFLICDANTMHMDEAAVSRIAQNPFTVEGPSTTEHYVRLIRDVLLKDVREHIPSEPEVWERVGARCAELALSGRAVDAICGNIRADIQDFEYPDAYFSASGAEREEMLRELCVPVGVEAILAAIERYHEFQAEAEERANEERFQEEVNAMVRQLNAGRAAAMRAAEAATSGEQPVEEEGAAS